MKFVFIPPHAGRIDEWLSKLREPASEWQFHAPESLAEAARELSDADAAFGTLTAELLASATKLGWLQAPAAAPAAGYYFAELIEHPVKVTNFRGIFNEHISAHILGMMLAFTNHMHLYRDRQLQRRWEKLDGPQYNQIFLPDATAAIIGLGGIGAETARLCKELGMRVVAVDARREHPPAWVDQMHRPDQLDAILPQGDFVIVTIPHTPATEGLFAADKFALMKRTAIFINIGRGMTTRLDDLDQALRSGVIGGAGLDVYEIEPLPAEHPLWDAPNTILTPHVASQAGAHLDERRFAIVADNLRRFAAGKPLRNEVDKTNWY